MSSKSAKRQQKSAQRGTVPARQGAAVKANPAPARKERGPWLTAAIVIMAIHGIFDTVALLALRRSEYRNIPPWLWGLAFLVGIATLVSAYGLWRWKRWGLWLYMVATAGSVIVGAIVLLSPLAVFYNFVPLALLGWILTSQRKMQLLV